ncbi:MAG TPA: hypothetical protein VHZ81_06325 [Galbitalea sp.]|jgi:hypothetical protein|nr:hypothetical protein [Galbitalea sp.]
MTYNAVRIVETGEQPSALFPSIDELLRIIPEPADGPLGAPLQATSVSVQRKVGNSWVNQLRASDISLELWPTGSRLLVYCRKYNKSGGWVGFSLGGLAVAVAANAISAGISAGQRRGKALVGGIRYPWIRSVSFAPRNGYKTRETLEIGYVDGTDPTKPACSITFHLPNHVEANRIARHLADKVIAYRYASGLPIADDALARYENLRTSGLMGPPKKGFLHIYRIPTSFAVPGGVEVLPSTPPPFPATQREPGATVSALAVGSTDVSGATASNPADEPATCFRCGSSYVGSAFCTDCGAALIAG